MNDSAMVIPRFETRPLSESEGGGYLIEFPDFPGCVADGETPSEALQQGLAAMQSCRQTLQELGHPIPVAGDGLAEQWWQSVPKSLHSALVMRAALEGVSLNTLVTMLLAEGIGRGIGVA